jgi:hypothetical protein
MCAQVLAPFEYRLPLDILGLVAGTYTVRLNALTASFTLSQDNSAPGGGG